MADKKTIDRINELQRLLEDMRREYNSKLEKDNAYWGHNMRYKMQTMLGLRQSMRAAENEIAALQKRK